MLPTNGGTQHRLGLLTSIDVAVLSAYCTAYARWRTAEETLVRIAANEPATRGLLVKSVDGVHRNPLIKVASDSAADIALRL